MVSKLKIAKITVGALGLAALLRSCTAIPAGHVGVVDNIGSVSSRELNPGFNWPVNPISWRVALETRTKEIKEPLNVPTKEGLMAGLDVSILYKINPDKADEIYKNLGINYHEVVLVPTLRNVARDVVANFSSEDLYGSNRTKIASEITDQLKESYAGRGIILEGVLLRDVRLPPEVTEAINRKIGAKQAAEQMQYVLQKETQESERKRIEAKGIADAQAIISESLTPEYLQWRYLTTVEALEHSPNKTFVIMPYDQKLTPLLPLDK